MSSLTESPFGFDELFFSRTDMTGVIISGNSVFQRVSKYEWNELLNRPHNLIRHPHMPKGVFNLLWETILAGKPIGAYVLNQAKDKTYYWVFALVTPIEGGFLSVRLKPGSPLLNIVKDKYNVLLDLEKAKRLSPKASQEILLDVIKQLEFQDYGHFMTEALTQEIEFRQMAMSNEPVKIVARLRQIIQLADQLQKKCEEILASYFKSSKVPINLEIQAARIGVEAVPIAVIASHYGSLAKQIREENVKFMDAGNLVQSKVKDCQFDICNSLLQKEMFKSFQNETKPSPIEKNVEMRYLENLGQEGADKARSSLDEIVDEFENFRKVFGEVSKLSIALDIVSISGKIEAAKINQSTDELYGLFTELTNFKGDLKDALKTIDEVGKSLIALIHEMKIELDI